MWEGIKGRSEDRQGEKVQMGGGKTGRADIKGSRTDKTRRHKGQEDNKSDLNNAVEDGGTKIAVHRKVIPDLVVGHIALVYFQINGSSVRGIRPAC